MSDLDAMRAVVDGIVARIDEHKGCEREYEDYLSGLRDAIAIVEKIARQSPPVDASRERDVEAVRELLAVVGNALVRAGHDYTTIEHTETCAACRYLVDSEPYRDAVSRLAMKQEAVPCESAGAVNVRGALHEDGSASVQFIAPDRRFSFCIEPDPAESSWHYVEKGGDLVCGTLSDFGSAAFRNLCRVMGAATDGGE